MEYRNFNFDAVVYEDYHYGETVYVLEPEYCKWGSKSVYLREKCPLCDDTRKISVRGYEFTCLMCSSNNKHTSTSLDKWRVTPFIVNSFEVHGGTRKSAYKPSTMYDAENLPTIRLWKGFCKIGTDVRTIDFIKNVTEAVDVEEINDAVHYSSKVFRDKKLAVAVCRRLHEIQKETLARFNEEHGTAYEYPFNVDECCIC